MSFRENRLIAVSRFVGYLRLLNRVLERDFMELGPGRCREDYSEREPSDADLAAVERDLEGAKPAPSAEAGASRGRGAG